MNLQEIKSAIEAGKTVCWSNDGYIVEKAGKNYYVVSQQNGYTTGLTWLDGVTLNGREDQFYTKEAKS